MTHGWCHSAYDLRSVWQGQGGEMGEGWEGTSAVGEARHHHHHYASDASPRGSEGGRECVLCRRRCVRECVYVCGSYQRWQRRRFEVKTGECCTN